jgi:hypothetical protein
MKHLTNEELLARTAAARGLAHRAPFAEWSKDHKGHSSIVNHTHAWASNGTVFADLADECDQRGLEIPPCDCPPGSHDWEDSKTTG